MTIKCMRVIIILVISLVLVGCAADPTATPIPIVARPATDQPAPMLAASPSATGSVGTPVAVSKGLVPTVPVAGQQPAAGVALRVAETDPAVKEVVVVEVVASGAKDLYGAQFGLLYDPMQLDIQDADESVGGLQISPGTAFPRGASFVALKKVDPDMGRIDFAATLLNPAAPLDGDVVLATFTIIGKQEGPAALTFEQVLLADRQGNALPVDYADMTLQFRQR